jgi:hypothetical protein
MSWLWRRKTVRVRWPVSKEGQGLGSYSAC